MTQMGDSIRRRRGSRRGRRGEPGGADVVRGDRALDLKRWLLGGLGGAALAFLLGWLIATQLMFPRTALAGDEVMVPELTGRMLEDARAQLESARLGVGPVVEMVHPRAMPGEVIAQGPIAGMLLRPGAEVRLAVSRGRARATVPDLVGMPADAAIELARRIGFEPTREEEPTIEEAGTVLRTRPVAGQQAEVPAPLMIVVSGGGLAPPEPEPVVPDTGLVTQEPDAAADTDTRDDD